MVTDSMATGNVRGPPGDYQLGKGSDKQAPSFRASHSSISRAIDSARHEIRASTAQAGLPELSSRPPVGRLDAFLRGQNGVP